MERLIGACIVLGALALLFGAMYFIQRRRMAQLAVKIEDFLVKNGSQLEFSVCEDGIAPLHNAAAELENRLTLAHEQLQEELRRTTMLTADISHQLKTPLASLRLFCEMDEGVHLEQQLTQIERMEKLIYSLLRLERLCADGYAFDYAEHDVAEIIRSAWESLEPVFPDRTLTVDGSAFLRCDKKWLGEAYLNLMKNACEHTEPGGQIRIRLERTQTTFFSTVEDDGGGVPKKDLPHLFERFYRAGGKDTGGAGIGLSIVQEIVRRHHGDVHAENAEKGLRFTISIPILNLIRTE